MKKIILPVLVLVSLFSTFAQADELCSAQALSASENFLNPLLTNNFGWGSDRLPNEVEVSSQKTRVILNPRYHDQQYVDFTFHIKSHLPAEPNNYLWTKFEVRMLFSQLDANSEGRCEVHSFNFVGYNEAARIP